MSTDSQPQPPSGTAYLRLVGLGALVGIPAALAAAGFLALVHGLQDVLWHDLPEALGADSPPWYLIVGLPVVGAAFVIAARRLLPGDGGHSPLDGIAAAPTPMSYGPGVALAALGTLPFGAVLGPEAPLIAIGSVVALAVVRLVRLGKQEQAVIAMAGSFSAVSALFGGPLVAGVLLVEAGIGMGLALIPTLIPGLVAAAVGYTVFTGIGDWGGVQQEALELPGLPVYGTVQVPDLFVAVGVGLLAALVIFAARRLGREIDGRGVARIGMPRLLLAGGLAVGLIALIADGLGANSQDVLFSGQSSLGPLLAEASAGVVVLLILAKGLAYAVSMGAGFRGGLVFPAIFLGVAIAELATIAFDVSPTLAAMAGVAAGMAAATRLIFSALVLATLLVGSAGFDALPAAVLAAVAAWLTITVLERRADATPS